MWLTRALLLPALPHHADPLQQQGSPGLVGIPLALLAEELGGPVGGHLPLHQPQLPAGPRCPAHQLIQLHRAEGQVLAPQVGLQRAGDWGRAGALVAETASPGNRAVPRQRQGAAVAWFDAGGSAGGRLQQLQCVDCCNARQGLHMHVGLQGMPGSSCSHRGWPNRQDQTWP